MVAMRSEPAATTAAAEWLATTKAMERSSPRYSSMVSMGPCRRPWRDAETGRVAQVALHGHGRLVSTELYADKAERARQNLREAELLKWVEIRVGDAFETLQAGCGEPVDMLLLDGWKPLCLPMLLKLGPFLAPGSLIVADDTCLMPKEVAPYLTHVRNPLHGYVSVALPLDDGLELSTFG